MKWQYGLVALVFAAACSNGGDSGAQGDAGGGGDDLSSLAAADFAVSPDLAPGLLPNGYPAGPYGTNVGDTIDDFTFQGYFSPTRTTGLSSADTYGAMTFNQMRKTQGTKVMLFWFAGFT
ncbi:MAG TPA: hypothetical protein VFF06_26990 [Polyangia bacterium]|nr:hypothetical protein [Polyangia bacterium]